MIEKVESTTSYEYKRPVGARQKYHASVQGVSVNAGKKTEGVILDLSINSGKPKAAETGDSGQFSVFKGIQNFFQAIKTWLIDFWESDSKTAAGNAETEQSQEILAENNTAEFKEELPAEEGALAEEKEPVKELAIESVKEPEEAKGIVKDISNENLELYTLLAEMSVGHIQLDDLDSEQVRRLLEIGLDLDAAEKGTFDYAKLLGEWSESLGLFGADGVKADTGSKVETIMPADAVRTVPEYLPLIEQAVHSGSLSRLEELITQNGTKKLAHNSDLLTYYDKKGQIVQLDDTQKERVLYGDRNILKL